MNHSISAFQSRQMDRERDSKREQVAVLKWILARDVLQKGILYDNPHFCFPPGCLWRECLTTRLVYLTVSTWPTLLCHCESVAHPQLKQLLELVSQWVSGLRKILCLPLISDVGFEIPDRFVVGYALDYNEYFRDLNVSLWLLFMLVNSDSVLWSIMSTIGLHTAVDALKQDIFVLNAMICLLTVVVFLFFSISVWSANVGRWNTRSEKKRTGKRRLSHRCHPTTSLNIFPEMPFTYSCYSDTWSPASLFFFGHSFCETFICF